MTSCAVPLSDVAQDRDDRSIDMLVARLRRKIEPNPKAPRFIVSVAGVGYKFAVRPQAADRGNALAPIDLLNRSGRGDDTPVTSPGQVVAARQSEPERRHLTVLSCRLVGAAALAAKLDPEDFGNTVRSFQGICTSVVAHLDRLSREQTELMIADVTSGKELPCSIQEQIISKADGIPLFVEELTKEALESGRLRVVDDPYVISSLSPSPGLPASLLGSLTARLDRLGPNKEIAQIGAVIGREFSYRLLAAVASRDDRSLQAGLSHIAARQLILVRGEPPNATYMFKHALLRDAAYATIVRSKRQQLHGRIADVLMTEFSDTVETQPELMAYHLAQAGLTEKANAYLPKAEEGPRQDFRPSSAGGAMDEAAFERKSQRRGMAFPAALIAALGVDLLVFDPGDIAGNVCHSAAFD